MLRLAKELSVTKLEFRCDSQLVAASQLQGEYVAKNDRMGKYLELAQSIMAGFTRVDIAQVPSSENHMVDALATLESNALYPCYELVNETIVNEMVVSLV